MKKLLYLLLIMKFNMLRLIRKKFKIFKSIIMFNTIDMMYNFFFGEVSFKRFFHNKAMFRNIALTIRKRMIPIFNKNIFFVRMFSTFPIISFFHSLRFANIFSMFYRKFLSFSCLAQIFSPLFRKGRSLFAFMSEGNFSFMLSSFWNTFHSRASQFTKTLNRTTFSSMKIMCMCFKRFITNNTIFKHAFILLITISIPFNMLICQEVFSADLFMEGDGSLVIAGSDSPSDIDTLLDDALVQPLDRLLDAYKSDVVCTYASASTLTVSIGAVVCDSSTGVHRMRENTSATTVTWSDLDTGSEAASTYYYGYSVGDADATTFTITLSASATAPTGVTYYKKIFWFHNDASSNIIEVGNVKTAGTPNIVKVTGTDDITTSSNSYTDMDDMVIYFVSSGRPVKISFSATMYAATNGAYLAIDVDGTDKIESFFLTGFHSDSINWLENLSAGTHTIKVQWKAAVSTTAYQYGSTRGARILTVEEL